MHKSSISILCWRCFLARCMAHSQQNVSWISILDGHRNFRAVSYGLRLHQLQRWFLVASGQHRESHLTLPALIAFYFCGSLKLRYDDESDFIPVISGGLVATTRKWWQDSGGFDPGMRGARFLWLKTPLKMVFALVARLGGREHWSVFANVALRWRYSAS